VSELVPPSHEGWPKAGAGVLAYQAEAERKARDLLREPPEPRKVSKHTARHFRIGGKMAGTVTIDKHGTISFRPLRRRKVYEAKLEDVVGLMVQRLAMAEAAKKRAERKHRKLR